jgi:hypothetical protein
VGSAKKRGAANELARHFEGRASAEELMKLVSRRR